MLHLDGGIKAFRGTMRIMPVKGPHFFMTGEWLYKPEYDTWYCRGESFPAEITKIEVDEECPG